MAKICFTYWTHIVNRGYLNNVFYYLFIDIMNFQLTGSYEKKCYNNHFSIKNQRCHIGVFIDFEIYRRRFHRFGKDFSLTGNAEFLLENNTDV